MPAFSPTVYPGQTIRARAGVMPGFDTDRPEPTVDEKEAWGPEAAKEGTSGPDICAGGSCRIRLQLYVYCGRSGRYVYSDPIRLPVSETGRPAGTYSGTDSRCLQELCWTIPDTMGDLVTEVGVAVENPENTDISILLDTFCVTGDPSYSVDFKYEQTEKWSSWHQTVSQFTCRTGHVFLEDGLLHLTGADEAEAYTGSSRWEDYSLRVEICPVKGGHHHAAFRVQGGMRAYFAGFGPDGMLEILKKTRTGLRRLAAVPFSWKCMETYELTVTAKGNEFRAAVRPKETMPGTLHESIREASLRVTDHDAPYTGGCIGFRTGKAGHLCCSRLSVSHVGEENENGIYNA